ncbi:hypothetical protein SPRG_09067 [Saprolegnia parasitica CBS 223.65]|uniref:ABC transporter domain-containing protein n=1 Tax=Saprolegnia parasitica (strain CBS 223.65) TaxID=695850 RepID=A0A067CGW2_SAPPC|nr:hypothetical protein SPRG_09067 [Saprolegnia parasitica CBS 223.65]KDO25771.1 hypothetical protein SPRG_09067 [Saprolegnia parasitica CBS 223.65]|eukprot:XP_012203576.1 hypothetical protein SPRG_09067 [Saprolegnia parasitica CBS 223.65]
MARASFATQTRVLLWKNATLKRRNLRSLLVELLLPVLLLWLLRWLATLGSAAAGVTHVPEARNADEAQPLPTLTLLPTLLARSNRVLGVTSPRATELIAFLDARYATPQGPRFHDVTTVFASERDMTEYAKASMTSNTSRLLYAGVVLDGNVATIRLSDQATESNGAAPADGVQPASDFGILAQLTLNKTTSMRYPGFLPLQIALHEFAAGVTSPVGCDGLAQDLDIFQLHWTDVGLVNAGSCASSTLAASGWLFSQPGRAVPFPEAAHVEVQDPVTPQILMYLIYLGLWPFSRFVRDTINEKETKMKEYLFILGVRESALVCSWVGVYTLYALVTATAATLLFSNVLFATGALVFGLIFLTFLLSAVCFGLIVVPFFDRAKTAIGIAPLLFLLWCSPLIAQRTGLTSDIWALLGPLTSPLVFYNAMTATLGLGADGNLRDVSFSHLALPWLTLLGHAVCYAVLGAYLDRVLPKSMGVQSPWHFPFHAAFWAPSTCPSRSTKTSYHTFTPVIETAVDDAPVVDLDNVTKVYPDGKVAVRNVSLSIPEGEIFGLLGANGAGKTTTLSMLSGVLAPTDGALRVCGDHDMTRIRQHLGVCFQQDVLYDALTIEEHVVLLEQLKGQADLRLIRAECAAKCIAFGLGDKIHAPTATLSGGSKRKVCVLLALLGDAKLVLLDEPTSGIDVDSQKHVWAAIQGALAGRAVLLTTHAMHEAQVLSHRIGIMANGELHCVGTSGALKDKYGVGYKLHVVKAASDASDKVRRALASVPGASVLRDHKWGLDCQLPLGTEACIPGLLRAFDALQANGVLETYDVSTTTLEDVFVKIAAGDTVIHSAGTPKAMDEPIGMARPEAHKYATWRVCLTQIRALMRKRAALVRRDVRNTSSQYLWPLLVFGGLSYLLVQAGKSSDDAVPALASPMVLASTKLLPSLPTPSLLGSNVTLDGVVDYLLAHPGGSGAVYVGASSHAIFFNASVPGALAATIHSLYTAACTSPSYEVVCGAEAFALSDVLGVVLAMYLIGALVFASTPLTTGIVKERESGLKQYQHFCGAWLSAYWAAHLLFDLVVFSAFSLILVLWCVYLASTALVPIPNLAALALCVLVASVAIVPYMYLLSFLFGSSTSAHTFVSYVGTFQLLFAPMTLLLSTLNDACTTYATLSPWLHAAFPLISLGETLVNLATTELAFVRGMCTQASVLETPSSLLHAYLWQTLLAGPVYALLVLGIDAFLTYPAAMRHALRCAHRETRETNDVEMGTAPIVQVSGLAKTYFASFWRRTTAQDVHALYPLDFTVAPGESVALLGVNGSGKSTTFQMLTAGVTPTAGEATVGPCNVSTDAPRARDWMGYCPQPNWLFDNLSVREHLELVCSLRLQAPRTIETVLTALQLDPVAALRTAKLSGGNKRRVMIAMAVVAKPPVLLLDEPSAGVDVVARRLLWQLLRDEACLFTTHCLEEAEAVCTSAVVLAKGKRVYRGSIAALKQQVSKGVTMQVTFCDPLASPDVQAALRADDVASAKALLPSTRHVEGATVADYVFAWRLEKDCAALSALLTARVGPTRTLEQFGTLVTLEVDRHSASDVTLADLFELLEGTKTELRIERYSISELALDQVFHHLT